MLVVLKLFVFDVFVIPSGSMLNTISVGDRVLVDRIPYRLHGVNRGDVVVFETPVAIHDPDEAVLIKRVVGLAGDRIAFVDGHVEINGQPIDEPYLAPGTQTASLVGGAVGAAGDPPPEQNKDCTSAHPCLVPHDAIWVMGDNRTNSADSRVFGSVPTDRIVGRAFLKIWPPFSLSGL